MGSGGVSMGVASASGVGWRGGGDKLRSMSTTSDGTYRDTGLPTSAAAEAAADSAAAAAETPPKYPLSGRSFMPADTAGVPIDNLELNIDVELKYGAAKIGRFICCRIKYWCRVKTRGQSGGSPGVSKG